MVPASNYSLLLSELKRLSVPLLPKILSNVLIIIIYAFFVILIDRTNETCICRADTIWKRKLLSISKPINLAFKSLLAQFALVTTCCAGDKRQANT